MLTYSRNLILRLLESTIPENFIEQTLNIHLAKCCAEPMPHEGKRCSHNLPQPPAPSRHICPIPGALLTMSLFRDYVVKLMMFASIQNTCRLFLALFFNTVAI